jgi:hypothetical protein
MADTRAPITAAARFAHGRLLCLLIGSYAIAALWPGPGLRMRDASVGTVSWHETCTAKMGRDALSVVDGSPKVLWSRKPSHCGWLDHAARDGRQHHDPVCRDW